MDREEILLREYEACQTSVDSTASRYWTILGIFISINAVLLGGVGFFINSNRVSQTFYPGAKWLVLVLGIGSIAILYYLWRWLRRINFYIRIDYFRMQEIENQLGMLKNRTIHWLDNEKEVPEAQKTRIGNIRAHFPPPAKETGNLKAIFIILGIIWIVLIIIAFIFY